MSSILLFAEYVIAILDPSNFHISFRISLQPPHTQPSRSLVGVVWNLWVRRSN